MKTYTGRRTADVGPEAVMVQTTVQVMGQPSQQLTPLKHIVLHSPDGFQWGYGGSGPAGSPLLLEQHAGDEA